MNIAFNIIALIVLACWAIKKPTYYVIGYFIYLSSFLGFIPNEIMISGIELSAFTSNIIPLSVALTHWKKIEDKLSKRIIITLLLFCLYGILKPLIDGNQGFVQSIISSKTYTFYFFGIYLITYKKIINFQKIFNVLLYISIWFSLLHIINNIGIRIIPPAYIKGDWFQCRFESFVPFALLYLHSPICNIKRYKLLLTIILLIGIYFGDFFSLLITILVLLPLQYLIIKYWKKKAALLIFIFIGLFSAILLYEYAKETTLYKERYTMQEDALSSRSRYNEFRWELIDKKYNLGYGFLHHTSHFLSFYINEEHSYMSTFTYIDSGYIDLMGKFGLYGTILFLAVPLLLIIKGIRKIDCINSVLFILQMLFVNITWSVFTYQMGIPLLAIAYSYILNNSQKKQTR